MEYLASVWSDFWRLSPTAQIAFVVGLSGLSIFSGIFGSAVTLFHFKNWRKEAERTQARCVVLESKLDAARVLTVTARAETDDWRPAAWLALARKERDAGNEEKAIAAINEGFERVRGDLGACAIALAGHHLSLIVGPGAPEALAIGARYARVAAELDPADPDAAFLAEEAALLMGVPVESVSDSMPGSFLPYDVEDASALIVAIHARARTLSDEGRYRIVVRLYRRAELIARRGGLIDLPLGLTVRYELANALLQAGHFDEALEKTRALLPLRERVSGAEHPNTLNTRHLEASILHSLGEHGEALDKLRDLLLVEERVRGANNPDTLVTRYLEASILDHLGKHDEALDKVRLLLPLREHLSGTQHIDTLHTRHLEANILASLGKHGEALDKLRELRPLQERASGAEHPDTLMVRVLEAGVLARLGKSREALDNLRELLPLQEDVVGAEHPDTLSTRALIEHVVDTLRDDAVLASR